MKRTVVEALDACARAHGDEPALRVKNGDDWSTTTWRDFRDRARRTARAFMALGLQPKEGVAIIGANRPEWFLADLGAIHAGGHPAGLYATSSPDQCQYIVDHSDATIVVAEDGEQLDKLLAVEDQLPKVRAYVLMSGSHEREDVHAWEDLEGHAAEVPDSELASRLEGQGADDMCTLIYTSGTTSRPKGVMLSHHNLLWTSSTIARMIHAGPADRLVTYLPLSHIAEQLLCIYLPIMSGASVWFAESLEKLPENMKEVHPTLFLSVPRLWEKIQAKITAAGAEASGVKKAIAKWARGVGLEGGRAEELGEPKPLLYGLADRIVFSKVREKLGLDQARMLASGTAPVSRDTLEFFRSLGLTIHEVYGLTETTAPTTLGVPGASRLGSVGQAIDGARVKAAADGEICVKGPHVFLGYYKDDDATAASFDDEGWFLTGDVGTIDAEGFVRITDRKKEVIVTSGGKNVAPQMVEAKLKAMPGVSQAVVVGDGRKYLGALIALDPENFASTAAEAGSPARKIADAAECDKMRAHVQRLVDEVNRTLSHVESIKRFAILPEELSVEGGELTPTLKLKRRVIHQKRADVIEQLYTD